MNINDALLQTIKTLVKQEIDNAPFDKTRQAIVLANNNDGTYKIRLDGNEYNNIPSYPSNIIIAIGSVVKVIIPNNQYSQMFILDNSLSIYEIGEDYIRYNNGLQICWINKNDNVTVNSAYGSLYQGTYTWIFPVAFSASPLVSIGAMRWGTGASWGTLSGAPTTTQAVLRCIDAFTRASGSTYINAIAIGWWK